MPPETDADGGFAKIDLAHAERHVFLCLGPDCCSPEEGEATWNHLKRRLHDLQIPVLRTKAACFRICTGGPWMVVYPEGIWYGAVTPERCEEIVTKHLVQNQPISQWIVREHPLPPVARE